MCQQYLNQSGEQFLFKYKCNEDTFIFERKKINVLNTFMFQTFRNISVFC